MITGAILGALAFGGIGFILSSVAFDDFWESFLLIVGSAMVGAGVIGGLSALVEHSNEPCPENMVQAGPENELYSGCVPVELAEKQVEND